MLPGRRLTMDQMSNIVDNFLNNFTSGRSRQVEITVAGVRPLRNINNDNDNDNDDDDDENFDLETRESGSNLDDELELEPPGSYVSSMTAPHTLVSEHIPPHESPLDQFDVNFNYETTCLTCLKFFKSSKHLNNHLYATGHYINEQIIAVWELLHQPQPPQITFNSHDFLNLKDFQDPATRELIIDPVVLPCGHLIGYKSLMTYLKTDIHNNECPICRGIFNRQQRFQPCKIIEKYMLQIFPDEVKQVQVYHDWIQAQELFQRFKGFIKYQKYKQEQFEKIMDAQQESYDRLTTNLDKLEEIESSLNVYPQRNPL